VDALMVPSMTTADGRPSRRRRASRSPQLVQHAPHLDHTGGNRFFRGATIVAAGSAVRRSPPGFSSGALLQRFMPRFAAEFSRLRFVLPTVTFEDAWCSTTADREIQLWHPGFAAHTVGDASRTSRRSESCSPATSPSTT